MAWFKKKESEKETPDLPRLPELPPLPDTIKAPSFQKKIDKSALPSFPQSPAGEEMSKEAVKHAVDSIPKPPEQKMPQKLPEIAEIPEKPGPAELPKAHEMLPPPRRLPKIAVKELRPSITTEPIFVRIDKYQDSLAKFEEIKKKILEIENLLRDVKEIKSREDAELQEWETEIHQAKANLDKIDRTLFKKLE